jgi:hypothetical protein
MINSAKGARGLFWMGIVILAIFFIVITGILYGAFQILTGGFQIKDPSVVAAVMGLIGTVLGYVSAIVQQVANYFFGSSKSSADKTAAMMQSSNQTESSTP